MHRMPGIVALLLLVVFAAQPAAADPLGRTPHVTADSIAVVASLPQNPPAQWKQVAPAGTFLGIPQRGSAPMSKPILLAGRCGSSNVYCSNPTPYCCGTGPANYYCAKDVNGCTR